LYHALECSNSGRWREVSKKSTTVEMMVTDESKGKERTSSTQPVWQAAVRANQFIDAIMRDEKF